MANPASLTVHTCTADGSIDQPTAQAIDTNGTVPIAAGHPTDRMIIECVNSAGQAITVTVKAGANPPSNASLDLATTINATTGKKIIGPFNSNRFLQADGSINVQFQAAAGVPILAVRVYKLPRM